jgi:hypothetical protein
MDRQNQSQKAKSVNRTLSPFNYFNQLQIEYIVCKFRMSIYRHPGDLEYLNRTIKLKEQRIKDMSEEHKFTSIFDDPAKLEHMGKEFMRGGSIPVFTGMCKKDIVCYFDKEAEFYVEGMHGIWKVVDLLLVENKVRLQKGNREFTETVVKIYPHVFRLFKEKIF